MSAPRARQVSVSRVVDAPAPAVFDVLADPAMHPVIDGSGTVTAYRADGGPERLALGTRFGMSMRLGLAYATTNVVVEWEEGRRIAWRHGGGHRWRYELDPVPGGTRVTETFDWSRSPLRVPFELLRVPQRHVPGMLRTLDRLADVVARPRPTPGPA